MRHPIAVIRPTVRCPIIVNPALPLALGLVLAGCNTTEPRAEPQPGEVIWKVPGAGWLVVPSYDSSRVYFGTRDHRVVAVDRVSGVVQWEASTGVGPGGTTAGNNTLVVGDVVVLGDVDLYAFDRATGTLRWVFRPSDLDETGDDRLGADSGTVYASSLYGRVYAIEARSGALRWVTPLPGGPERTSTFNPVESGGVVYVGVWHETSPLRGGSRRSRPPPVASCGSTTSPRAAGPSSTPTPLAARCSMARS